MMSLFAQEIIAKGKPEWVRLARKEGEVRMLTRLLQRRFGAIPAWAQDKIANADILTLEEWSLQILDAHSLEDVFGD